MGLGCWAIGGIWWDKQCGCSPAGWGQVDDGESIRAIQWAVDAGITLFDTADNYGCGHSEHILGQVLAGRRDQVILATEFGYVCNQAARYVIGSNAEPTYIRRALEASLRRLNTDYIDLYQFHLYDYDLDQAVQVRETLEELVREGKIRWYGWSTNNWPARAFLPRERTALPSSIT
jgi:aryl-alcohol dehydrogenase-like predicted oxidoreductase